MQFMLVDLALTFAALTGYRVWQLLLRRAVPVSSPQRAVTHRLVTE